MPAASLSGPKQEPFAAREMKGEFLRSYLLGPLERSSRKLYPCGIHKTCDEDARKFLCLTHLHSIFL
jgi:hypothetical protein